MFLLLNIFQYFSHSLTKLSNFCVIGHANCRATKWRSNPENTRRGWVIVYFYFFEKKNWRPFSSSSPISSSLFLCTILILILYRGWKKQVPGAASVFSGTCSLWTLLCLRVWDNMFVGLAYQGKDIVFTFIIVYSSLRDFGP
jgi:hypothetical protein